MKQIIPVIDNNLYGLGSSDLAEINILEVHCDEVTCFELLRPDSEAYGIGLHLKFNKVEGQEDLWVRTASCGKVALVHVPQNLESNE